MEYEVLISFVQQLGFPIAVCIGCFWYINKLNDNHKEEIKAMSDAVNNNTIVMQKLVDKMEATYGEKIL